MSSDIEGAGLVFVDPSSYADDARFHEACTLLRARDPLHLVSAQGFTPFRVATKHHDIITVETHSANFLAAPRPMLVPSEQAPSPSGEDGPESEVSEGQDFALRTLINTDGAIHRNLRAVTADWFHPRNLAGLESNIAGLARGLINQMWELGGSCDFVRSVAARMPLSTILTLLGLPESDAGRFNRLTQEMFSSADEGLATDLTSDEIDDDFVGYFSRIIEDRRSRPTNDLASVIANAKIDGSPIGDLEAISYFVLIATAGHDTAAAAIAGGLDALIRHPEQLRRLQHEPQLMTAAIEEMIRWVTPVKHFMRTAQKDFTLRDVVIREGESVLLSYPSANRDEEIFSQPFAFDVARSPNRHLAFGTGPHYCLGAHLARMEMKALFAELLPRLRSIEHAGPSTFRRTLFVGGLTSLPIRYELNRGAD